jgi:GH25 family lysozyme M1 (1,4-beta-N-acetylmuramidase)
MIGHACKNEHKTYKDGQAGDQTKVEVYIRTWYNRPWNVVLRAKDKNTREKLAQAMEMACKNESIGYAQNTRNTLWNNVKNNQFNPSKTTKAVNTDCSALVCVCCAYAGVPIQYLQISNNSLTTSTLRKYLLTSGMFEVLTDSKYLTSDKYLLRGDILLYEGHHTAINLDDGIYTNQTTQSKSIDEIAREVIAGKWGSGEDRKKRLTNAGYNYSEVQARVNQILKGDKPTINRNLPIIDLSHHNTVSDWNKVTKSVGGVILRLGYRSYGGGVITTDKKYNEFLAQVKSHNIPYGIYFFPTSINEAEANAEADYILKMVSGLNLSFPIYLDSEIADTKTHNGRSDKLDKETRTRLLKVILDRLKAKGYDCGVYASTSWLNNQLNMSKLNGYKVWVAQYNTVCTYGGSYNMWQYSSKAQIDGVVGNCDVSKLK